MNSTDAPAGPAFLFDLDGTLVDSVYQHVLARHEAMRAVGMEVAVWTIHHRIGMSGGVTREHRVRTDIRIWQKTISGGDTPRPRRT